MLAIFLSDRQTVIAVGKAKGLAWYVEKKIDSYNTFEYRMQSVNPIRLTIMQRDGFRSGFNINYHALYYSLPWQSYAKIVFRQKKIINIYICKKIKSELLKTIQI